MPRAGMGVMWRFSRVAGSAIFQSGRAMGWVEWRWMAASHEGSSLGVEGVKEMFSRVSDELERVPVLSKAMVVMLARRSRRS